MAHRAMRAGLMSKSASGIAVVQSAVTDDRTTVSLSGVTSGNLILALAGANSQFDSGALTLSGFPATFATEVDSGIGTVIRAGYATGTSASFRYDRLRAVAIIVEISGADVSGVAEAHNSDTGAGPMDGPSLSGFTAKDIVIGFGYARGTDGTPTTPSGWTLIQNGTDDGKWGQAIWKLAVAGSNSATEIFGSADADDNYIAHTIRIPAA